MANLPVIARYGSQAKDYCHDFKAFLSVHTGARLQALQNCHDCKAILRWGIAIRLEVIVNLLVAAERGL